MTEQWAQDLMQQLEERMRTYTKENVLRQDEASGLWYLRTYFAVYPDRSVNVLVQSMVFEIKAGVPLIEVVINLTNDVKEGTETELEKALGELNYISPVGVFGMRRKTNRVYLRNCWPLDPEKPLQKLAEETEVYYTMMMEAVQGGYAGLKKIWTGEMDYEQVVQEKLLNRAAD